MIRGEAIDQEVLESLIGGTVPTSADLDELGYEIAASRRTGNSAGFQDLWEKVKSEFRILLCTEDAKYADLRKHASELTGNYTATLVTAVSTAIAVTLSTTAALLTPLVSLLILAVARVGKNAICSLQWGA